MQKWRQRFLNVEYQREPCECHCTMLDPAQSQRGSNRNDNYSAYYQQVNGANYQQQQQFKNSSRTNLQDNPFFRHPDPSVRERVSLSVQNPKKKLSVSGLKNRKSRDVTLDEGQFGNKPSVDVNASREALITEQRTQVPTTRIQFGSREKSSSNQLQRMHPPVPQKNYSVAPSIGLAPRFVITNNLQPKPVANNGMQMLRGILTPEPSSTMVKQRLVNMEPNKFIPHAQIGGFAKQKYAEIYRPNIVTQNTPPPEQPIHRTLQVPPTQPFQHFASQHMIQKATSSTHYPSENVVTSVGNSYISGVGENTRPIRPDNQVTNSFNAQSNTLNEKMKQPPNNKYGQLAQSADHQTFKEAMKSQKQIIQQDIDDVLLASQYYSNNGPYASNHSANKFHKSKTNYYEYSAPQVVQQDSYEYRSHSNTLSFTLNDRPAGRHQPPEVRDYQQFSPPPPMHLKDAESVLQEQNQFTKKFRRIQSIGDDDNVSRTDDNVSIVLAQYNHDAKGLIQIPQFRRRISARQSEPLQQPIFQENSFGRIPPQKTER